MGDATRVITLSATTVATETGVVVDLPTGASNERSTADALKELADLAKTRCNPDKRESCAHFIEADTAFHVGIALLARNQVLVGIEHCPEPSIPATTHAIEFALYLF